MSQRPIEAPVVTVEPSHAGGERTVSRHPAFAQIVASRTSGHKALYGSDFRHQAYMTIRIARSELNRDLSRDWHFGREPLIEVALSEAQWATFVSAPNIGSGVPCTIQGIDYDMTPGLPDPENRADQYGAEVRKKMASSIGALDKLIAEIDGLGLSKAKAAALKEGVEKARQQLKSNIPFVAQSFDEHMEETVEKAKVEIHGYMTGALIRSGLEALGAAPPLQLEYRADVEVIDAQPG